MNLKVNEPSAKYLVRTAHQPSEVGPIPADWSVTPIQAIAKVTSGKRLPMGHFVGDRVTAHPYIRVTDMRIGTVALDDIKYVPDEAYPPITNYRIFKEDLFISVAGTLGVVGKIPDALDGANLTENADRISEIRCDRDYLMYILLSPVIQDVIESAQTVGAQPKLALARIRKFSIPLPPTATEQRAIATALSDVDALIAGLERLIAKKRNIKQAAMQQLLTGQTRLPGFSGEWEVARLGNVASLKNGYMFRSETYTPTGAYKVITIANVQDGQMFVEGCNSVAEPPADIQSHQQLEIGDILISMTGNVGRVCRVSESYCLLNQRVGKLVPIKVKSEFLFALLRQPAFIARMIGAAKGGAQPNLSASDINEHEFLMPTDSIEQSAVATILSGMDADLSAHEFRLNKTRAIKQSMMQELLTGRTRLL